MESLYTFMQTIGSDMVSFLSGGYHEVLSRVDELYPDQPDWVDKGQQPGGKNQYDTDDGSGKKKPDGVDDDDDDEGYRASSPSSSSSSGSNSRSRHSKSSGNGNMPNAAASSSASARVSTSKEGVELRRMVANFASQAHLANDLDPASLNDLRQEAHGGARGLDQQSAATSFASSGSSGSESSRSGPLSGPQASVSAVTAALVACAAFALGIAFQNQKAWAEMSSQRFSTAQYTSLM